MCRNRDGWMDGDGMFGGLKCDNSCKEGTWGCSEFEEAKSMCYKSIEVCKQCRYYVKSFFLFPLDCTCYYHGSRNNKNMVIKKDQSCDNTGQCSCSSDDVTGNTCDKCSVNQCYCPR